MDSELHFKSESQVGVCADLCKGCGASYYWLTLYAMYLCSQVYKPSIKSMFYNSYIQGVGYENAKLESTLPSWCPPN